MKEKINIALVLALPYLKQPFKIQTIASDYAMGAVLMQHGKPICYHSETFTNGVINYPTYDKELYALVQSMKKKKHYLMGKETIIHTNHQPLQYIQSQNKLQKVTTSYTYQVDGIPTIISFGNQVQERQNNYTNSKVLSLESHE